LTVVKGGRPTPGVAAVEANMLRLLRRVMAR